MNLITGGFIHLEAGDYLHQDQSLKKKLKFCPKNFPMKTKVTKLVKIGYIDKKLFIVSVN